MNTKPQYRCFLYCLFPFSTSFNSLYKDLFLLIWLKYWSYLNSLQFHYEKIIIYNYSPCLQYYSVSKVNRYLTKISSTIQCHSTDVYIHYLSYFTVKSQSAHGQKQFFFFLRDAKPLKAEYLVYRKLQWIHNSKVRTITIISLNYT